MKETLTFTVGFSRESDHAISDDVLRSWMHTVKGALKDSCDSRNGMSVTSVECAVETPSEGPLTPEEYAVLNGMIHHGFACTRSPDCGVCKARALLERLKPEPAYRRVVKA